MQRIERYECEGAHTALRSEMLMQPVKFGLRQKAISDARLSQGQGTMANATAMQQPIHCAKGLVIGIERYFDLALKCPNSGFNRHVWAAIDATREMTDVGYNALSNEHAPGRNCFSFCLSASLLPCRARQGR
eukprot:2081550-Prymnesium_polylepis.1